MSSEILHVTSRPPDYMELAGRYARAGRAISSAPGTHDYRRRAAASRRSLGAAGVQSDNHSRRKGKPMKIWAAIEAPNYQMREWGRAAQFERTNVANAIRLLASRVEKGTNEGILAQNDVTISFKVEQDGEQSTNGEAA